MTDFFWRASHLRHGMTAREMARLAGRSEDAARSAARRHGVALRPISRGHSQATRLRALRMLDQGMSKAAINRATGIDPNTLRKWEREA